MDIKQVHRIADEVLEDAGSYTIFTSDPSVLCNEITFFVAQKMNVPVTDDLHTAVWERVMLAIEEIEW